LLGLLLGLLASAPAQAARHARVRSEAVPEDVAGTSALGVGLGLAWIVVELQRFVEGGHAGPDARVLLYLGSSLRSFQPHEIEAGVPDPDRRLRSPRPLDNRSARDADLPGHAAPRRRGRARDRRQRRARAVRQREPRGPRGASADRRAQPRDRRSGRRR
jgi:hypothetical protein